MNANYQNKKLEERKKEAGRDNEAMTRAKKLNTELDTEIDVNLKNRVDCKENTSARNDAECSRGNQEI